MGSPRGATASSASHLPLAESDTHPHADPEASEETDHTCGCNEVDDSDPELDARTVPHAIRHGRG